MLVPGSCACLWWPRIVQVPRHCFSWNSHFLPSGSFITNYLASPMSTASIVFVLQVQREQTERLGSGDCPPVSFPINHSKNSMPLFLLNSFLEQIPILHICSFFLFPILVPRFPVYHFRQSGSAFHWEEHPPLHGAPEHLNKLFKHYNMENKLDFTW